MFRALLRLSVAFAMAAGTSTALAEGLIFNGATSDGVAVSAGFNINIAATPFLSDTLSDGTLHNRFQLSPNGITGISGGWRLDVGSKIAAYYGYEDLYYLGVYWGGPVVDVYLHPDGHSSLTLDWATALECHGGCSQSSKIHLDLSSSTGGLFTNAITSSVFSQYTSGSGTANWYETYTIEGPPISNDRSISFTLSAVPEPQTLTMALAGLVAVAGALRRRVA
jgi:hypothetical protein